MSVLLSVLIKLFPVKTIYGVMFTLAEWAVKQTDNTLDNKLLDEVKRSFGNE